MNQIGVYKVTPVQIAMAASLLVANGFLAACGITVFGTGVIIQILGFILLIELKDQYPSGAVVNANLHRAHAQKLERVVIEQVRSYQEKLAEVEGTLRLLDEMPLLILEIDIDLRILHWSGNSALLGELLTAGTSLAEVMETHIEQAVYDKLLHFQTILNSEGKEKYYLVYNPFDPSMQYACAGETFELTGVIKYKAATNTVTITLQRVTKKMANPGSENVINGSALIGDAETEGVNGNLDYYIQLVDRAEVR